MIAYVKIEEIAEKNDKMYHFRDVVWRERKLSLARHKSPVRVAELLAFLGGTILFHIA